MLDPRLPPRQYPAFPDLKPDAALIQLPEAGNRRPKPRQALLEILEGNMKHQGVLFRQFHVQVQLSGIRFEREVNDDDRPARKTLCFKVEGRPLESVAAAPPGAIGIELKKTRAGRDRSRYLHY